MKYLSALRCPSRNLLLGLTLLIYVVFLAGVTARYGFNASSLMQIGERDTFFGRVPLAPGTVVFSQSDGYDGQYFYYIARDPLFQTRQFDNPVRYQRIGYPLLASVAAMGHASGLPFSLVAVNLAAILAGMALFISLVDGLAASRWLSLLYAFNPGQILGLQMDLAFPLQMALCTGALVAWRQRRLMLCSVLCATALLVSESSILFVLPFIAATVLRRDWRDAGLLALSAAPYLALQVLIALSLGAAGLGTSAEHIVLPLQGVVAVTSQMFSDGSPAALLRQGLVALVMLFVTVAGVSAARWLRRDFNVFDAGVVTHAIFAAMASHVIWIAYASAGRVFAGMFPLVLLSYGLKRDRMTLVLVIATAILSLATMLRPFTITPAVPFFVTS